MAVEELIPSWLTSWVAWRDFFTNKSKEPFDILVKGFGLGRLPLGHEWVTRGKGVCPFCKGDSVVYSEKYGLVYCICQVLDKINRLKTDNANFKTVTGEASLDDIVYPFEMGQRYKTTMGDFVEAARDFIKYPHHWLFVSGYVGTGKTHVLKAINTAFDPMALYVSTRDLEQMTHTFRKEDALDYFYDALIMAPILILDDIGMEYGGPLVKSVIEKVVDARYEKYPDSPMVVSTNLLVKEFPKYIPRASDRLLDKARTKIFQIQATQSYRSIEPEMRP
jgi:DNA replication protein DnaC